MAGWHHRLNGHGFGWTPGVDDGQGGLVCCGSRGHKESDTTERLNFTDIVYPTVCVYIYIYTHTYMYEELDFVNKKYI